MRNIFINDLPNFDAQKTGNRLQNAPEPPASKVAFGVSFLMRLFLLLMLNCVITLSKWLWNQEARASGSAVNFDNGMMQFIIIKRTHA